MSRDTRIATWLHDHLPAWIGECLDELGTNPDAEARKFTLGLYRPTRAFVTDASVPSWLTVDDPLRPPLLYLKLVTRRSTARLLASPTNRRGVALGVSLTHIYIHPHLRRQGIASRVLATLVDYVTQSPRLEFVYIHRVVSEGMRRVICAQPAPFLYRPGITENSHCWWCQ